MMSDMAQQIVIFEGENGDVAVTLQQETVWLNQAQLFARDQSVVSRHTRNVFKDGELPVAGNMQKVHIAGSDKPVTLNSLDVIISVGYRVKSPQGVRFRQWATRQTPATNNMTQTTALRVTHPTQGKDAQRGAA